MKPPILFDSLMGDDEMAFAYVCASCATRLNLETSDTCCNGNICQIKGCQRTTSLCHYVFDYRIEVINPMDTPYFQTIAATTEPRNLPCTKSET